MEGGGQIKEMYSNEGYIIIVIVMTVIILAVEYEVVGV